MVRQAHHVLFKLTMSYSSSPCSIQAHHVLFQGGFRYRQLFCPLQHLSRQLPESQKPSLESMLCNPSTGSVIWNSLMGRIFKSLLVVVVVLLTTCTFLGGGDKVATSE